MTGTTDLSTKKRPDLEFIENLIEKIKKEEFTTGLDLPIISGYYEEGSSIGAFYRNKTLGIAITPNNFYGTDFFGSHLGLNKLKVLDLSDIFPLYAEDHTKDDYASVINASEYTLNEPECIKELLKDEKFRTRLSSIKPQLILNCCGRLDNESALLKQMKTTCPSLPKAFGVDLNERIILEGIEKHNLQNIIEIEPIEGDVLDENYIQKVLERTKEENLLSIISGNSLANFSNSQLDKIFSIQKRLLKERKGSLLIGTRFLEDEQIDITPILLGYMNDMTREMFKEKIYHNFWIREGISEDRERKVNGFFTFTVAYSPKEGFLSGVIVRFPLEELKHLSNHPEFKEDYKDIEVLLRDRFLEEAWRLGFSRGMIDRFFREHITDINGSFLILNKSRIYTLAGHSDNDLTDMIRNHFNIEGIYEQRFGYKRIVDRLDGRKEYTPEEQDKIRGAVKTYLAERISASHYERIMDQLKYPQKELDELSEKRYAIISCTPR